MNRRARVATVTVIAGLALTACGGSESELSADGTPVEVVVSTVATAPASLSAPATVVAAQRAELATRVSGTIESVRVDIGSTVARGDTLVVLDTDEIDARIQSARAGARLARQSYERIAALAEDGAATRQELDDARARLEQAEAALRDARAQRPYVILRAPFAGVITLRRADPGDLATPGASILTLLGTQRGLKIVADLPGELAGGIAVGDEVNVLHPDRGERIPARVTRVVPAVDQASRRFRVEAVFAAGPAGPPPVVPGTFVRLELERPSGTTHWIPTDAVFTRGQLNGVFVVVDGRLRIRWIRPGLRQGDALEILAGLPADAVLVRDPAPELQDGQPVAGMQRTEWSPPTAARRPHSTEGPR